MSSATGLSATLDPELRAAFDASENEHNRRRLRVLFPLMAAVHVVHVLVFWTGTAQRESLAAEVVRWRDYVATTHAATAVLALLLGVVAVRAAPGRGPSWLAAAGATLYLLHGAVIVGVDQLTVTSVTPFIGYCLGCAVIVSLSPRATIVAYVVGLASFVAAILVAQPSSSARLATLPNGASIAVVSVVLSWFLHSARRRDFVQRVTIEKQREELGAMNAVLEQRVSEQVAEIVARAAEVSTLNAQLKAQVRARSTELSLALSSLARERHGDGTLRAGVVLGDRFEIEHMIGEGGMGAVYSGVDRTTGSRVAIKIIQAGSSHQLDALHRFLREARTAATVSHPAVVRMLHVDVSDDGMLYQVQELVSGSSLQSRLRHGHAWSPQVTARCLSVLCDALAAAHAEGVIHRDVKPSNVMLTTSPPGLKLLDFGISKVFEETEDKSENTQTGTLLGTPAYMGPEQVTGSRHATDRSDVYAVGVMLFLMLTGRHPFEESTPFGTLVKRATTQAPDVRTLVPSLPDALADLVSLCLQQMPDQRPSAGEVAARLRAFADTNGAPPLETLEKEAAVHDTGRGEDLPQTIVDGTPGR